MYRVGAQHCGEGSNCTIPRQRARCTSYSCFVSQRRCERVGHHSTDDPTLHVWADFEQLFVSGVISLMFGYSDGVNHVGNIAAKAGVGPVLVCAIRLYWICLTPLQACAGIRHLLYSKVVALIDIFQYRNEYVATSELTSVQSVPLSVKVCVGNMLIVSQQSSIQRSCCSFCSRRGANPSFSGEWLEHFFFLRKRNLRGVVL